jgi:tetratricopeptide (TPR) repeat protein
MAIKSLLQALQDRPADPDALAAVVAAGEALPECPPRDVAEGTPAGQAELLDEITATRHQMRAAGALEAAERLLELEARLDPNPDRRLEHLLDRVRLLAYDLLRQGAADKLLETALRQYPDEPRAVELRRVFQAEKKSWKATAKELSSAPRGPQAAASPSDLAPRLMEAAALHYRFGSEASKGDKLLVQSLEKDPKLAAALDLRERRLLLGGKAGDAVALWEQQVAAASKREQRAAAHLRAARILRYHVKRPERAAEHYKQAVAADGADLAAWVEYAELLWRRLADLPRAQEVFQKVRRQEPSHPMALAFFREHHRRNGELSKWITLLTQAVKAERIASRKVELAVELAMVTESEQGNAEKAIDAWRAVLRDAPMDERAGAALVRLYTKTARWNALLERLKESLEQLTRRARGVEGGLVQERVRVHLQMAAVYRERLGLDAMALGAYQQALALDSSCGEAFDALAARYEQLGRWTDLAALIERRAAATPTLAERSGLSLRLAELFSDKMGNAGRASAVLEETARLPLAPDDLVRVRARLKELYQRRRSWRPLLELMREELDTLDGTARQQQLVAMAELAAERIAEPSLAADLWTQVWRTTEPDAGLGERALRALMALHERDGRLGALAEVLDRLCELLASASSHTVMLAPLLERRATLYAELHARSLATSEQLIAVHRALLAVVPEHAKGRRALRDHLLTVGDLQAVEQLYVGVGADEELVESLRVAAERTQDGALRRRLWRRLAALLEMRLGQPERAISVYEKLHALDPQDPEVLRTLATLQSQQQSWVRLLSTQQALLALTTDPAERLALYRRIIELCDRQLGAKGLAFDWCVRAIDELPAASNPELAADAEAQLLDELTRLAAAAPSTATSSAGLSDRWEGWFDVVVRRTEPLAAGALRRQRVVALAAAALERSVPLTKAERWLEELVDHGDDAEPALRQQAFDGLVRLLTGEQRWAELVARLERQLAGLPSSHRPGAADGGSSEGERAPALQLQRLELLYQAATVLEERLGDRRRAIELFQRALERDPTSSRALAALERLFTQERRWSDLAELWRSRLASVDVGTRERAELLGKLGQVLEQQLGQVPEALECYRGALDAEPNNGVVVAAVERILRTPGEETGAPIPGLDDWVARLGDTYERSESWTRLAELLELAWTRAHRRAEGGDAEAAGAAGALAAKLAVVYGERLGDPDRALQRLLELVRAAPAEGAWRRKALSAAVAVGRVGELALVLDRLVEERDRGLAERPDEQTGPLTDELRHEAAALYGGPLRQPQEARQRYAALLDRCERAPSDLFERAAAELAELLEAGAHWAELRALYRRWTARPISAELRRGVWARIATLCEHPLDDLPGAVEAYRQLLELGPGASVAVGPAAAEPPPEGEGSTFRRALGALERIYLAEGQLTELDALLAERHPGSSDAEWLDGKVRRAEVQAFSMNSPAGALDLLAEVVRSAPSHRGARRLYERLMSHPATREQVARVLEPAYIAEGSWNRVIDVLTILLEHSSCAADDRVLLGRIARIQEEHLDARLAAFQSWSEALRRDPTDPECRDEVWRLGALLERWRELAAAWEESLAALATDTSESGRERHGRALGELATVYERLVDEEPTGTEPRAIGTWRRLLELGLVGSPWNGRALEALEGYYRAQGSSEALVALVRRAAELTAELAERQRLLHRLVVVLRGDLLVDEAVATYLELLHLAPDDKVALDGLEALYLQTGDSPRLVELLYRRRSLAQEADDPVATRALGRRIAELWHRDIGDLDRAIDAYRELLDSYESGDLSAVAEREPDERATVVGILETLARLYRARERWPALLETLQQLYRQGDPKRPRPLIVGLVMEIGAVLDVKLGDQKEAFDYYSEVLDLDPFHLGAREAVERMLDLDDLRGRATDLLAQLYRTQSDFGRLAGLELRAARAASEPAERLARLLAVAELRQHRLGDDRGAYDALRDACQLLTASSELTGIVETMAALAAKLGTTDGFVGTLRELAPDVLDPEVQAGLYARIADHLSRSTSQLSEAIEYHRKVLEVSPGHVASLTALERAYEGQQDWPRLLEILQRRLDLVESSPSATVREQRLLLVRRCAQLCLGPLDRPSQAVALLEQVVELAPDDRSGWDELEALYRRQQRPDDVAALLRQRAEVGPEEERAALNLRLALLYANELSEPERAMELLCAIVERNPSDVAAVSALESLGALTDPEQRDRVFATLEGVYLHRHDWKRLVTLLEQRVGVADGEGAASDEIHLRLARLHEEQLEDFAEAFCHVAAAFVQAPLRARYEWLGRLANLLGRWKELVELLERVTEQLWEPGAAGDERSRWLTRELAEVAEERLGDLERAQDAYRALWLQDPTDTEAFARLDSCLVRGGRFAERVQLYLDAQSTTADSARRRELLHEVARTKLQSLGDLDGALAVWREIIDLAYSESADGHDVAAEQALERALTEGGRWDDLVEYVASKVLREPSPLRRVALRLEEARLHETRRGDLNAAIDLYTAILEDEPRHVVAVEALERLILHPAARLRVASTLEPVYRAQDEWGKLIVVLDSQVELVDDVPRRVALLREVAELHERKSGAVDLAFAAVARAWREEPDDTGLFVELERLATRLENWRAFVRVVETVVPSIVDKESVAQIWGRAAEIYAERLGDRPHAIAAWRYVETLADLTSPATQVRALTALVPLLRAERRHAELAEALERLAASAFDAPAVRQSCLREAALLYEQQLGQPDRAAERWRELSLDARDGAELEALERLSTLYERKGAWSELAELLTQRLALVTSSSGPSWPLRRELALLVEERLDDAERAAQIWQPLALDPEAPPEQRRGAWIRLGQLFERLERWRDAAEAIEQQLPLVLPEHQLELHERAGRLYLAHLDDDQAATEHFIAALRAAPHRPEPVLALERLARRDGADPRAFDALRAMYSQTSRWEPLVELLEHRRASEVDPVARATWVAQLAAVHETERGQPGAAFRVWARELGELARGGQLEVDRLEPVERLASSGGLWRDLATLYRELLDASERTELVYRLTARLTTLYAELLHEPEAAVEMCCRALEAEELVEPATRVAPPLVDVLDRLLERLERWTCLAEIVLRRAERAASASARAGHYVRLGQLRLERLGDLEGAVDAWREVLALEPDHRDARQLLEELVVHDPPGSAPLLPGELRALRLRILDILAPPAQGEGELTAWLRLQEWRLGLMDEPAERTALFERIAERYEHEAHDPVRALDALGRAFAEELSLPEPSARLGHLVDQLERLAGQQGRWAELLARLEGALASGVSAELVIALGLRAAKLALHRLGDRERCERHLRTVIALEPDLPEAWELVEVVQRAAHEAASGGSGAGALARRGAVKLEEALRNRARLTDEPILRRGYLAEAARLREHPLGDLPGAVSLWREVIAADAADPDGWGALARLLELLGDHRGLAESLERLVESTADVVQRVAYLRRLGHLWREPLGDPERAEQALRDALVLSPGDGELLSGLEAIHRQRRDWPRLQELLLEQLQWTEQPERRRYLLGEMARVADEHLEDRSAAITLWQQRLEIAPATLHGPDEEAEGALERLLAMDEQWEPLLELLTAHADRCARQGLGELELPLLLQAAELADGRLGERTRAMELLHRALARAPSDARALTMVARLAEQSEDWQRCAEVLEQAVAVAPSTQLAELRLRLARIYRDRLHQRERAREHLQHAAAGVAASQVVAAPGFEDDDATYDPMREAALQATLLLEELAREDQDDRGVAQWVERRAELLDDVEARVRLLVETAQLLRVKLGDAERACRLLEAAVALGVPGQAAVEPLAELTAAMGRTERSDELLGGLLERAQAARNHKGQSRLKAQLARNQRARGRLAEALALFDEAHRLDSTNLGAQLAIAQLATEQEDWERARRTYRSLLLGQLDPTAGLTKADIYLALGRVHEKLGEHATAKGMYQRGLELDAQHPGLRAALE